MIVFLVLNLFANLAYNFSKLLVSSNVSIAYVVEIVSLAFTPEFNAELTLFAVYFKICFTFL